MNDFDPYAYLISLNPSEFDKYSPKRGVNITAKQTEKLLNFLHSLPQDRNMLLYFWRFVFCMDMKIIRRFARMEHANGIIEALRFTCKRYLAMEKPISNAGMGKAFELLLPDYEIILLSVNRGLCWQSGKNIDAAAIRHAIEETSMENMPKLRKPRVP